ncbi:MAG TPA: RidA family protein [Acidimicrobiales bacterium]|jgi:enamine deaminase RidA (YjgF/YER057c/UK114 family)|nr:RidA family protein [Acidimicrobiales bacterium]
MSETPGPRRGRRVVGTVDAGGIYTSRLAGGGDFIFLASTAFDETGGIPAEVSVPPPYHASPSAVVRAQTRYIFERYREGLEALDSSIDDIVQLEQYIELKAHADGYVQVARGPGFMEKNRPGSLLIQAGHYLPPGAVVSTTGMALVPDPARGIVKEQFVSARPGEEGHPAVAGDRGNPSLGFAEIVTGGPYGFATYYPIDYQTGIHPEARAPDWIWWGSEIRQEAQYGARVLKRRLDAVGSDVSHVVNYTLYLTDLEDLYEFDLVWRETLGEFAPSRTVVPVRGMGTPRQEGAKGQAQGACKMEIQYRFLRPGFGIDAVPISTGRGVLGHESEAVRAGDLLWISEAVAGDPQRPGPRRPAGVQMAEILERLDETCEAAGSSLRNLLRLRAFVTEPGDAYAVYGAVKKAIPHDPPCVCVTVVPGPLQVPGCTVLADGVAWIPG